MTNLMCSKKKNTELKYINKILVLKVVSKLKIIIPHDRNKAQRENLSDNLCILKVTGN